MMNTYYAQNQPIAMNVYKLRSASIFRTYARTFIYPQNQELLCAMFRTHFGDNIDMDTDDGIRYTIKCRSKRNDSLYYSHLVELSLANLFASIYKPVRIAVAHSDFDRNQQQVILSILSDINTKCEFSEYLKMIYVLTCMANSAITKTLCLLL